MARGGLTVAVALAAALAAVVVGRGLTGVAAVPPSRFNRDIDEEDLEEAWADEESETWHEDTFEWKRRMAAMRAPQLDIETLAKSGPRMKDLVYEHEATNGNIHMSFATIKSSVTTDPAEIQAIGERWQALLQTDGSKVKLYPIGGQDLLFTEDDGRILEIRDFVLRQPELEKFRWKDTDFTPLPSPSPTPTRKPRRKAAAATPSATAAADKKKEL